MPPSQAPIPQKADYLFETHHLNPIATETIFGFILLIGIVVEWAFFNAPGSVETLNEFYREWIGREMLRKLTWFDVEDNLNLDYRREHFPECISKLPEGKVLQKELNFLFLTASLKLLEPSRAILASYNFLRSKQVLTLSLEDFVGKLLFEIPEYLRFYSERGAFERECVPESVRHQLIDTTRYICSSTRPSDEGLSRYFSSFEKHYATSRALLKLNRDNKGLVEELDIDIKKANKCREGILSQIATHYVAIQLRKLQLQANDDARSLFFCLLLRLEDKLCGPFARARYVDPDGTHYHAFITRFLRCLNEDLNT